MRVPSVTTPHSRQVDKAAWNNRSTLHCQIRTAQGRPAMDPQSRCKPRWRPVTHFQPINRTFAGLLLPAYIRTHLTRVEVPKAGLASDSPVVVVVETLRPAEMVGGFAQTRLERRTCSEQVALQRRTFLFAVGRDFIPAHVAVRVAMKFEGAGVTHRIDLGPSQDCAISFPVLYSPFAFVMIQQLRKFIARVRVSAWGSIAGPARDQKAQGGKAVPL